MVAYQLLICFVASTLILTSASASVLDKSWYSDPHNDDALSRPRRQSYDCSDEEFQCLDGSCIGLAQKCDGKVDCRNGDDERACRIKNINKCNDGTEISIDQVCDGKVNCPDRSDESHALCRKMQCPDYLFRCTYGACVDGLAPCNNVTDCADNSDELLPRCRKESSIVGDKFKCENGERIDLYLTCDGVSHCADGSDEQLRACAAAVCADNLFQCAYGACVDEGADCNDIQECADGSDEDALLCKRTTTTTSTTTTTTAEPDVQPQACVLPQHPKNGVFRSNVIYLQDAQTTLIYVNTTCYQGYKIVGDETFLCSNGVWSVTSFPKCMRACKLEPSDSVVYRCLFAEWDGADGTRDCGAEEVEGALVQPECRRPNYFSSTDLPYMLCADGAWNYRPKCNPECGTLTPRGTPLILGGQVVERGEVSWHAGIYWKNISPAGTAHEQICGGSLISDSVVLSAAHCFWNPQHGQLPSWQYALAVGKLHRAWDHPADALYAQKRNIKEIVLSERYFGAAINYQYDMAVVAVSEPFYYRTYIRPICLSFDPAFNEEQLRAGNLGKVAGWGLTTGHKGSESPTLKVLDVPFVPFDECFKKSPQQYVEFLSADKICAGYGNGTTVCKGDSGGGLGFPATVQGTVRYFLRGIVSTSPPSDDGTLCNLFALTSFTEVIKHESLIKKYWYV
ncbi:modular serine protease-like isoform X2 [Zerene cesonia]|uniref:modular serine protease-like isoform X2 n=1 Tax=Zerene cesonia TaxID=33412 RepID=UPI0018E50471|nr:modular serine protease-like isoform X2 [Zerene cesonia]